MTSPFSECSTAHLEFSHGITNPVPDIVDQCDFLFFKKMNVILFMQHSRGRHCAAKWLMKGVGETSLDLPRTG